MHEVFTALRLSAPKIPTSDDFAAPNSAQQVDVVLDIDDLSAAASGYVLGLGM